MISLEDILYLHECSIKDYGGINGIRDLGLLKSAIARPFQTFGGEELYLSPYEKAAALAESLIINHPFIDGNKRTGLLGMAGILFGYSLQLNAAEDGLYNFIIKISTGEADFDSIVEWLKANTSTA
ncbi:MAG: type II toxin-antitoxin system death-on-curing family toxin [Niabella sp.]